MNPASLAVRTATATESASERVAEAFGLQMDRIETSLARLRATLVSGDALATETVSQSLRDDLAQLARASAVMTQGGGLPADAIDRLQAAARELLLHRDMLHRRAVPVERGVQAMFPSEATTYAVRRGAGGFGAPGR